MMNLAVIAIAAYGVLIFVGGIIGFAKSQSKISLISGCLSGLLLLIMAGIYSQGINGGLIGAQLIITGLIFVFVLRLRKTGKFMPAGLMIILGGLVAAYLFLGISP